MQLSLDDLDVLMDCLELTVADLDIHDKDPKLLRKAQKLYVKLWKMYAVKCLEK